jgi:hypothetical protein
MSDFLCRLPPAPVRPLSANLLTPCEGSPAASWGHKRQFGQTTGRPVQNRKIISQTKKKSDFAWDTQFPKLYSKNDVCRNEIV